MHLSKLQLLGFKSFPEKTELNFKQGITCVVGPNGCGKTNLIDALRWVLGESRMSVLRGSRLEEVIFAGTRDLKPLGMADVSITFDNHDHTIPSGYDEINVTRRLFRSGDSEFLINRTPCRLKDITNMFLDTGLGSSAYSVIEPSMVDILISDKTEDRRFLFEEAAGITKYKQRKHAAIRKLNATEGDLLRHQDVLAEVRSQVSVLKRQVSKAERYKKLQDEIKKIGISLSSGEWTALDEKEGAFSKQLEQLKIETNTISAKQKEYELKRERIILERTEHEQHAKAVQSQLEKAVANCHKLENEISVLKEKLRNATQSYSQAGTDIDNLTKRHESLEKELEENQEKQDEVTVSIEELNRKVAEVDAELERGAAECSKLERSVAEKKIDYDNMLRKLAEKRESQLSLDLRYSTDNEKLVEIESEVKQFDRDIEQLSTDHEKNCREERELGTMLESRRENISRLELELDSLTGQLEKLEIDKIELAGKLEKVTTRLEFLEKVISDYDGYSGGTAAIGQLKGEIPGIIDTVSNLIETDPDRSSLIQAVLGEFVGCFVVENDAAASAVLDRVRSDKLGRVGLITKSRIDDLPASNVNDTPPGCKPIRSLVSGRDEFAALLDFLFDGHYLADSDIDRIAPDYPTATIWSLEGESVASGGKVHSAGSQEVVLVGRKHECEILSKQRQKLKDEIGEVERTRIDMAGKRNDILSELSSLREDILRVQEHSTELSIKKSNLEYELTVLRNHKSEKQHMHVALAESLDIVSRDRSELSKEMDQLQADKRKLDSELAKHEETLKIAEDKYSQSDKENNRLKMELIGLEGQLSTLRSNRSRLDELRNEISETTLRREMQQSEFLMVAVECKRSIRDIEKKLKIEYTNEEEKRAETIKIGSTISESDSRIGAVDTELKGLRQQENKIFERIHEADLEVSSVRTRKQNLVQESIERYDFDPSTSSLKVKLAEEQRAELDEELTKLRNHLDSLGPVNMLALEEYEDQNKRYQFLSDQINDLIKAKEDLKSTIGKINNTAKRLFKETLEMVRINFQQVFRDLFDGGEADIKLEEDVDPLETNIIITARPRGKKILSIQQLSGGERALTAISLLFSLYLVKPSPFCILDEVDAPLDHINNDRFINQHSQSNKRSKQCQHI